MMITIVKTVVQSVMLFLVLEFLHNLFIPLLSDCLFSFSPTCHHSEKLAEDLMPPGRLP